MEPLLASFGGLFAPVSFTLICLGVALGIIFGAIPGLTGGMLMALALPFTFYMSSENACVLLVGMYVGGVTGGLITAILLRIPGSPSNVVTTFDGYPLAQQGKPERALALGVAASAAGGAISWLFLAVLSPPLTRVALSFSPFEYFAFATMGLVLIASVSGDSLVRGLIAGVLGMLVALPGLDQSSGQARLTFGWDQLVGGFNTLPVLIGVFAGSQLIADMLAPETPKPARKLLSIPAMAREMFELRRHPWNVLRSSVIGTWIGFLPAVGGNVGSIVAYSVQRQFSKAPERFGKGAEDGVVASETANNATIGGALIPLIAMGIPGSLGDVMLLAALVLHNVQPGPLLLQTNPSVYYGIISSAFLANFVMLGMMLVIASYATQIARVPRAYLIPAIFVFCVVGSFALHGRMFDVGVMFGFAVLGFAMEYLRLPLAPFVIGLILSPLVESNLRSGLMASDGDLSPFATRPIALACLLVSAALFLWPFVRRLRTRAPAASA
jgi:putative tricarboxylic transport membrane protein